MSQQTWQRITHIAIWMVFLSFPLMVTVLVGPPKPAAMLLRPPDGIRPPIWILVCFNLLLAVFYFVNYYLLIPRLLTQRRRLGYGLSIAGCFILLLLFIYTALKITHPNYKNADGLHPAYLASSLFFMLIWAASSGVRLNFEYQAAEKRRKDSENARLESELGQLRTQLNPHFLFNTLNGIYTLTLAKNDMAPQALLRLSNLLRYVMADTNSDKVPLVQDLEHLRNFIELHQMRLTDKTPVTFTVNGDPAPHRIGPLLLLPFVENAIKHGSSTREYSPITLKMEIQPSELTFECTNFIRQWQETPGLPAQSTGIGLENTRRRLDLLYPDQYKWQLLNDGETYTVKLTIPL
jgi:two-component system, LytTR family, sensor kinase